ncbi:MAG: hypothetical protein HYU69_13520 [Bacteroidetes bacterium]|nr:hypothetical protein [Bacteroidota bacterium]
MNRYYSNISWFSILLFASGLALLVTTCCCKYSDLFKDITISLFSAILLLWLSEIRDLVRDNSKYGLYAGTYKRTEIYDVDHKATIDSKYISLIDQYKNVDPKIQLRYLGDRKYKIEATYKEGKVTAIIYLDSTNSGEGNGNYQYSTKLTTDIGNYRVLADTQASNKLIVYYKNIIPSGLAEGYEVWQRL